jgi:hypothetical protein
LSRGDGGFPAQAGFHIGYRECQKACIGADNPTTHAIHKTFSLSPPESAAYYKNRVLGFSFQIVDGKKEAEDKNSYSLLLFPNRGALMDIHAIHVA